MSLSTIAFVIPYFGKVPNYFPLLLHTASFNPTIEFRFFGNADPGTAPVPKNVTFTPMTIDEFVGRARQVLGFEPVVPTPYKLCDYRPAYGLLFAPELRDVDYWGHVDVDVLLGNLREFITEELLHGQLRTFMSGHLSVYRNSEESNNIFRLDAPGVDYRKVFRDPRNCVFDEWKGMYLIHQHHGIPFHHDDTRFADAHTMAAHLRVGRGELAVAAQVFTWENGQIIQWYESQGRVLSRTYMHLHLQKRRMAVAGTLEQFWQAERWYVTGDQILPGKIEPLTPGDLRRMNPRSRLGDFRRQAARPLQRVRRMVREWRLLREAKRSS